MSGEESNEVRSVDPDTGAEKGTKLARFDLIPTGPLEQLAEHYGRGSHKYSDRNWERGYDWSKSYAALQRHLNAFWGGEDFDPELGSPHLVAAAWHCFTLLEFMLTHPEKDDRPTTEVKREAARQASRTFLEHYMNRWYERQLQRNFIIPDVS